MRKYLLLLAGLGLTLPTLAQTERGAKLIGVSVGDLHYERSAVVKRRVLSAALYPSIGWFVDDRLALGSGLILLYERSESENSNNVYSIYPTQIRSSSVAFGVTPFGRYYFYDGSAHKIFGQLGGEAVLLFERSRYKEGPIETNNKSTNTSLGWNVGAGYNYFLSPNLALEATAVYRRSAYFAYLPDRANAPRAASSFDVRLGFSVFLPSAKPTTAE